MASPPPFLESPITSCLPGMSGTDVPPPRIQAVEPAVLDEIVGRMADELGITRAALVDALALRISEQRIARIIAGMPSSNLSPAAAVGTAACIIAYLGYLSGPAPEGGPALLTSAEFAAELERLAAGYGVARADLVRFIREAAEMRIADALTILRLMDTTEASSPGF